MLISSRYFSISSFSHGTCGRIRCSPGGGTQFNRQSFLEGRSPPMSSSGRYLVNTRCTISKTGLALSLRKTLTSNAAIPRKTPLFPSPDNHFGSPPERGKHPSKGVGLGLAHPGGLANIIYSLPLIIQLPPSCTDGIHPSYRYPIRFRCWGIFPGRRLMLRTLVYRFQCTFTSCTCRGLLILLAASFAALSLALARWQPWWQQRSGRREFLRRELARRGGRLPWNTSHDSWGSLR